MQSVDVLNRQVFKNARKMPDVMPEIFVALEEYDKTGRLRKWGNKIRVNFTIDPVIYRSFKEHCQKHGYKMSTLIEKAIRRQMKP